MSLEIPQYIKRQLERVELFLIHPYEAIRIVVLSMPFFNRREIDIECCLKRVGLNSVGEFEKRWEIFFHYLGDHDKLSHRRIEQNVWRFLSSSNSISYILSCSRSWIIFGENSGACYASIVNLPSIGNLKVPFLTNLEVLEAVSTSSLLFSHTQWKWICHRSNDVFSLGQYCHHHIFHFKMKQSYLDI